MEQKSRSRGRPRSFDELDALEQAVRVFWEKGYDGVTIDDLVARMGVGRPSLYAVFGDKAELFNRVLLRYSEWLGAGAVQALAAERGRDALARFFEHAVRSATAKDTPLGCLLACVAPAIDDPKVRAFLAKANAKAVALVEERLRAAVDDGELARDFPAKVRARQAIDLSTGLVLRARLGHPRAALLACVDEAIALLLGPPPRRR